ncbi:hypothetical protein D0Z07_2487 [Hyphodiscus hymeniophilus]|uniref:Uncharacterized protein n=1 Tax=Hyphodiscus hymeniophilus TaxID=353542 RepID=A0A9P6VN68_9HELO|nr:hypothetical protein D0Z07_2487 [Hyphodiscus hymeniophilus]
MSLQKQDQTPGNGTTAGANKNAGAVWIEVLALGVLPQVLGSSSTHRITNKCAQTSTCIPNNASIQLLAPIGNPDICPLWSERWELRSRPLGCHVSTITFLTCIISVLSTFLVIGVAYAGFRFGRWARRKWKSKEKDWWIFWKHYQPGWWRGWRLRLVDVRRSEETERSPLLAEP